MGSCWSGMTHAQPLNGRTASVSFPCIPLCRAMSPILWDTKPLLVLFSPAILTDGVRHVQQGEA